MNKKAFALVELLVVMVVLSIISLVAVPAVINVIDDSKEKIYQEQEDSIVDAARKYIASHSKELPAKDTKKCLTINELKDAGLLKNQNIKNPVGKNHNNHIEKDEYFNGGVLISNNSNNYTYVYVDSCETALFSGKVYAINMQDTNTVHKDTSTLQDIGTTYESCAATGKRTCIRYTLEKDIVIGAEACMVRNGNEYCITGWDEGASWETNKATLEDAFAGTNACKSASPSSTYFWCSDSGFVGDVYKTGSVRAFDGNWLCYVLGTDNVAYCKYRN